MQRNPKQLSIQRLTLCGLLVLLGTTGCQNSMWQNDSATNGVLDQDRKVDIDVGDTSFLLENPDIEGRPSAAQVFGIEGGERPRIVIRPPETEPLERTEQDSLISDSPPSSYR